MSKKSSDDPWDISQVYGSWAARCQFWSILTPTLGARWRTLGVENALQQLRYAYRTRLTVFHQALPFLHSLHPAAVKLYRNCPPCGVRSHPLRHFCRFQILCPFCFARFIVRPLFERLRYLSRFRPFRDLQVVSTVREELMPYDQTPLEDCLREQLQARTVWRSSYPRRSVHGGWFFVTVEPARQHLAWRFLRRELILLSPGTEPHMPAAIWPADDHWKWMDVSVRPPVKKIAQLVARLVAYPSGLLRHQDLLITAEALQALHGIRNVSTHGLLLPSRLAELSEEGS